MRTITKLTEPPSLTKHRATAHADYDNYGDKDELREQLVTEQRGLCCYCGGRIFPSHGKMKIAYWLPQKTHPQHQLDYWNLLGACMGNEGQPFDKQHCDTHQRDSTLSRNPADPKHRIEDVIVFQPDGSIASKNPDLARELGQRRPDGTFDEGILNLNLQFLRTNRKSALSAFTTALQKRGNLSRETLQRLISKWHGDGPDQLDSYAPVIVYWLRKRLARCNK